MPYNIFTASRVFGDCPAYAQTTFRLTRSIRNIRIGRTLIPSISAISSPSSTASIENPFSANGIVDFPVPAPNRVLTSFRYIGLCMPDEIYTCHLMTASFISVFSIANNSHICHHLLYYTTKAQKFQYEIADVGLSTHQSIHVKLMH